MIGTIPKFKYRVRAHEITLIALVENEGGFSVAEIVETSNHFATGFIAFFRGQGYVKVAAIAPGRELGEAVFRPLEPRGRQ